MTVLVPRLVTVWFPDWPVVAAGLAPETPAAVLRANRVIAVSAAAAAEGVAVGLRRREAQGRCSSLQIVDHDPEHDARRFEPVVWAVGELVPLLEVTEPGCLTFATRGPSRYVGGDDRLADRVAELAAGAAPGGAMPGVGIADGRFASGVAARRSTVRRQPVVVAPGPVATAGFLADVPLRALCTVGGLTPETIGLFERLGVRRLGGLAALPAADLLARFGPPGELAHALSIGADPAPPDAVPPPPDLVAERVFDTPVVQLEPLVFLAKQAAGELHQRLGDQGSVVTRLAVEAETEHGERTERLWYRPEGFTAAAMVERVRWQLDGWVRQPGGLSGGVEFLRLVPVEVRADNGRQLGFWGGQTQADEWALRATTRLAGLLGAEAVVVPEWRGGREPAAAYALVPASATDLAEPGQRRRAVAPATGAPPWPGALPSPSPACVFPERQDCEVLDASGEPVGVTGRGAITAVPAVLVRGRRREPIHAWAGPWPVEERWWDPAQSSRRVRCQLVTHAGEALLVSLQAGAWGIDARYD